MAAATLFFCLGVRAGGFLGAVTIRHNKARYSSSRTSTTLIGGSLLMAGLAPGYMAGPLTLVEFTMKKKGGLNHLLFHNTPVKYGILVTKNRSLVVDGVLFARWEEGDNVNMVTGPPLKAPVAKRKNEFAERMDESSDDYEVDGIPPANFADDHY